MTKDIRIVSALFLMLALLAGCSFNPFYPNNELTGSATGAAVGATVGAGTAAAFSSSKTLIALSGLTGAAIGYYVTTIRYDAGGIMRACGEVYKVGDFVGIYIPSDKLFEPNTDELLPQSCAILDSAVAVLKHYPNNNILISGNTSGFYHARWEQNLAERRAQKVAAYFWNAGLNQFKNASINCRKLAYVGYGDYFPIANHYNNCSLRQNSRIQITSYPSRSELGLCPRAHTFNNYAPLNDDSEDDEPCDLPGCNDCAKDCKTCG